jgi:flagellar hook-basal body complex protein FliE
MIRGIGQEGSLARAAIEAALAAQGKVAQRVEAKVAESFQVPAAQGAEKPGASPLDQVRDGLGAVNEAFGQVEQLPLELAGGGIADFSELAARLKQSELTFKFALEVRNKLIDAYRETMRMSV